MAGEDPLGKAWREATVVGLVGNAATVSLANPEASEFYHPIDDEHMNLAVMIVRVDGDPSSMIGVLAGAARAVDPRVSISARVLRDAFDVKLRLPRQMTTIVWALGALALALAAVGLAGLVVFTVSQRAREIGIRLALGARPRDVIDAVLSQFRQPVLWGLAGGFLSAAVLSKVLASELFGLSPFDPVAIFRGGPVHHGRRRGDRRTVAPRARSDPISALKCE